MTKKREVLVSGVLAVTVALIGVGCGGSTTDTASGPKSGSASAAPTIPAPVGENSVAGWNDPVPDIAPRATPGEAVSWFLSSEIAGDFEASFAVLSEAQRSAIGGLSPWVARHSMLPRYLTFDVVDEDADGSVTTEVTSEPRLDEIVGYLPARSTIVWSTVRSDDGFTVALDRSRGEPTLPDESGAVDAATNWVKAATEGERLDDLQYDGNLIGQPDIVDALVRAGPSTIHADSAELLDDWPNAVTVTNAFGPSASQFTRVVRVDGPDPIDVVVAPLGESWRVVGVVAR